MTTKEAAARVRRDLNEAVKAANRGSRMILKRPDGTVVHSFALPRGLSFEVRATRTGVNVEIGDGYGYELSYVDDMTGGDRRAFGLEHAAPIVKLVEDYERAVFGTQLGKITWGMIVIGAEVIKETRVNE